MLAQIFAIVSIAAAVQAGAISYAVGGLDNHGGLGIGGGGGGGIGLSHGHTRVVDYHTPAHYEFKYGVEDAHTGDKKQQSEVRVGDTVKGEYSLAEPDGTIRVVKYTADPHNGFNAIVSRVGHAAHPQILHRAVAVTSHGGLGLGGLGGGYGGGLGGLGGHGY